MFKSRDIEIGKHLRGFINTNITVCEQPQQISGNIS